MLLFEMFEDQQELTLVDALRDFLPLAMDHLNISNLPKIHLKRDLHDTHVPTFGRFENDSRVISVDIENRHPNDILRTIAHELVHFAQGERGELDSESWHTGSNEEDEANAEAGVIMRKFNTEFSKYLKLGPVILPKQVDEEWSEKYKRSIDCSNPKGFSQRAHCQGRKKANESEDKCPPATQDIVLNLKNRQKAIDEYGYGPLNPLEPNVKFWKNKADMWQLDSPEEAKKSLCGNCAAFDVSKESIACIEKGIGTDSGSENPHDVVEAGDLGYCRFLKFKCASLRTCDAWVVGGPITEGKHCNVKNAVPELKAALDKRKKELNKLSDKQVYKKIDKIMSRIANTYNITGQQLHDLWTKKYKEIPDTYILENFADGKNPGRKGLAKRSGVNCKASVTQLRKVAKNSTGEKQRMAHWCANMKSGRNKG